MENVTLSELSPHYDTLFCDVWGVIRDGHDLLPEAVTALVRYREGGGRVCLVSNSPRLNAGLEEQLLALGLPREAFDAIVTSGDAILTELVKRTPGKVFTIGPNWDDTLYGGLPLEFVGVDEADFISVTGPDDYWDGKPEDYDAVFETALARGLDLVCANPDIVVQAGDRLIYCAGAIARRYREKGGTSIVAGKPHRPIYHLAIEALGGEEAVNLDRVLAIGDGPETDIAGADRIGVDALFIGGGILEAEMQNGAFEIEAAVQVLKSYGVAARWGAARLVW
ncbi:MAG: TIGR01459 family HAD-type hydrolase [Alphaproteobacteria bacterium]|nr:TIGR01459 family HAD-type hydrolase [Alphaproteobacteria bacterium]